jgi:hypothetical protein
VLLIDGDPGRHIDRPCPAARPRHAVTVVGVSYPHPGQYPGDPYRGGGHGPGGWDRGPSGPAGPPRGASRPGPGGSGGGGGSRGGGGRSPRSAIRLDPVIVECLVAVAWLTVGSLGLGSDGAGTLLLAAGIALVVFIVVENRRRGSRAFDPRASADLLRYGAFAIGAILVLTVLLGLISAAGLGPGVAAVITGVAFLALARSTGQRPTQWLGIALIVLGVLAALMSTQETSSFVSQGLLGLVCGVLVLLSAADRIGLLETLRDRVR